MAPRWKLLTEHYLRVPGTKWQYQELDRGTGKQIRRDFEVGLHLDPRQPGDWTHVTGRDDGEIIVTTGPSDDPKDIVFVGTPTPDMLPVNDEAKAITDKLSKRWNYNPETAFETGEYARNLVDNFQDQMATLQSKLDKPAGIEGMAELLGALTKMMEQNATIITALTQQNVSLPTKAVERKATGTDDRRA